MPYGPSVPHMFIVTFVIMLPVYLRTNDPIKAWQAGLAWSFIIGLIVLAGAFVLLADGIGAERAQHRRLRRQRHSPRWSCPR
jgi:xanthine/uracil/vitamin C permease (AzgA family)